MKRFYKLTNTQREAIAKILKTSNRSILEAVEKEIGFFVLKKALVPLPRKKQKYLVDKAVKAGEKFQKHLTQVLSTFSNEFLTEFKPYLEGSTPNLLLSDALAGLDKSPTGVDRVEMFDGRQSILNNMIVVNQVLQQMQSNLNSRNAKEGARVKESHTHLAIGLWDIFLKFKLKPTTGQHSQIAKLMMEILKIEKDQISDVRTYLKIASLRATSEKRA